MLKGPRLKTVSYRTLRFPEYGMANASNFTRGFTPASNPERGKTYGQRNGLLFMLKGPRLKTVSYRTLGFPSTEWPMQAISREALPLPATPKGVTKLAFIYVNRAKAKNSFISHLRVARVRNVQCKQFHARLYPGQQLRKG